jgi:hypothetical protein
MLWFQSWLHHCNKIYVSATVSCQNTQDGNEKLFKQVMNEYALLMYIYLSLFCGGIQKNSRVTYEKEV